MNVETAFGLTLKAYREQRGLTQEGLGFDASVTRNYISDLERGRKSPTLGVVFALCHVLEVSPDRFIADLLALQRCEAAG